MNEIIPHLLSNAYSAFSPSINLTNALTATCTTNGILTECPAFLNILSPTIFIFFIIVALIVLVSTWKMYEKAGKQGWTSLIPIYNAIVLLEIIKKPTWWIVLFFIPIVNMIMMLVVTYELARAFGKGIGYTVGILVFPFIFYPMIAFGDARYIYEEPIDTINDSTLM